MPEVLEPKILKVEKMPAPETSPEQISSSEKNSEKMPTLDKESQQVSEISLPQTPTNQAIVSDDEMVLQKVENILSANMDKVFLSLDISMQTRFKIKGEETAKKISGLLRNTSVKTKDILSLILEWLRIVPKINKHFLEQEAKIKTDNILKLHKEKQN
ncbi:hypothetical protein KKH39_03685 [Patescibacteria group bacterium]|nr:hypothetical protein [Patescibacteria group bacterium]